MDPSKPKTALVGVALPFLSSASTQKKKNLLQSVREFFCTLWSVMCCRRSLSHRKVTITHETDIPLNIRHNIRCQSKKQGFFVQNTHARGPVPSQFIKDLLIANTLVKRRTSINDIPDIDNIAALSCIFNIESYEFVRCLLEIARDSADSDIARRARETASRLIGLLKSQSKPLTPHNEDLKKALLNSRNKKEAFRDLLTTITQGTQYHIPDEAYNYLGYLDSNHAPHASDRGQEAPPETLLEKTPTLPLTSAEQNELSNLRNQHGKLVEQCKRQELDCQAVYQRVAQTYDVLDKKANFQMTFAGTQVDQRNWMSKDSELYGESFDTYSRELDSKASILNHLKGIENEGTVPHVTALMKSINDSINEEIYDQNNANTNPYVARFCALKSALLKSIGVVSTDELSKSMSRMEFKLFQSDFEEKILKAGINKIPLGPLINHFVEQGFKKLPKMFHEPPPLQCSWLSSDEIKLLETLWGLSYFGDPDPKPNNIPDLSEASNTDAMHSYRALCEKVEKLKNSHSTPSAEDAKYPEMLDKINHIKKKIENQSEDVRKELAHFINNKRRFTKCVIPAKKALGKYATHLLRRAMSTLSDQPPISNDALESAFGYELKQGSAPESWFLTSRNSDKCVKWSSKEKAFIEGCSQEEAETSYDDNKPLLCVYDESLFASEITTHPDKKKNVLEKIKPPPSVLSDNPDLFSSNDLTTEFSRNKEALERKIEELRKQCAILSQYKEKAIRDLSAILGRKLTENNPAIADLSSDSNPMKLEQRFSELNIQSTDVAEEFNEIPELKDTSDRVISETVKACYNIVTEYIDKNTKTLSKLLQNMASARLEDEEMNTLRENIEDLHYKSFDLKWESLKKPFTKKLYDHLRKNSEKTGYNPDSHSELESLNLFVNEALHIIYKMRSTHPPMTLDWLPENSTLTEAHKSHWKPYLVSFNCNDKEKDKDKNKNKKDIDPNKKLGIVDLVFWPTVSLHKNGNLMREGHLNIVKEKLDSSE